MSEEKPKRKSPGLIGHPMYQSKERSEKLSKAMKGRRLSPATEFKKGREGVSYWKGKKNPGLSERNKIKYKGEGNPAYKHGLSKTNAYKVHYNRLRKMRLKGAFGSFTLKEWEDLKKSYNYTCLICKKSEPEISLTVDHIIPIVKGGRNTMDNIQPLCGSCNSKKHGKILEYVHKTASLVIGAGEVGIAVHNIFKDYYRVNIIDEGSKCDEPISYLHICFPYDVDFVEKVTEYQFQYKPAYTIVHSTVPVGTCRKLDAISSPIRGLHPHLEKGVRTFVKFIGGERASEVAEYFRRAGLRIQLCDKSETTELGKLLDTEYYRMCIEFCKKAKELSNLFDVSFLSAYTLFNQTYNEGYSKLGYEEYVRPVLQPIMTDIKGHCVMPNKSLLEQSIEQILKESNE